MNTNKFKKIPLIITAILTLLFCPLVLAWANMSLEVQDALPNSDVLFELLLYSLCMVASAMLNWICRSILSLTQPYLGALIVSGFFLNIAFVLCYNDGFGRIFIGVLIAVFFLAIACLIDKPLRAFWKSWSKNSSTIVSSFRCIGINLLFWAVGFVTLLLLNNHYRDVLVVNGLLLLGYACLWGRVYEIAVSYSPKPWLTRAISMVIMLGGSFAAFIVTISVPGTLFSQFSVIVFWTTFGLLLYDLGCFVAERIRKKLASKKQGSLEETAEA